MSQDWGWLGGEVEKAWSFRGGCQLHARGCLGPAGAQVRRGLSSQEGGWPFAKGHLRLPR